MQKHEKIQGTSVYHHLQETQEYYSLIEHYEHYMINAMTKGQNFK